MRLYFFLVFIFCLSLCCPVLLISAEESDAVDIIVDRMQKRTNDNYDKPNKHINEELAEDIKKLYEALKNITVDQSIDKNTLAKLKDFFADPFVRNITVALSICKDANVEREILLTYGEKVIEHSSNNVDSIKYKLQVLSEIIRINRKQCKDEKEFVQNRYFHADKMLELWSKATVDMIDGWTMGSELPLPEPYKPPKDYKGFFGVGVPELIEDEKVRKEYESYLEERAKVWEAESMQDKLFSFAQSRTFYISYLIELYSQQPYNRKELLDLVEKHKVKGKFKEELLQKVKTIKEK